MNRAVVFGVGGVGSHLAYFLTRVNTEWVKSDDIDQPLFDELVLVDFDNVEEKNLNRQMFFQTRIITDRYGLTSKKCALMGDHLSFNRNGSSDRVADGSMKVRCIDRKITDELDLAEFDRDSDFAFICTDNMASKLLLFRYFENKMMVSCDKDYYEIKTRLDSGDNSVFEFGGENGAYSSAQTFSANVVSAMHAYRLVLKYGFDMPEMIIREKVDSRLDCTDKGVIWNPTMKKGVVEGGTVS